MTRRNWLIISLSLLFILTLFPSIEVNAHTSHGGQRIAGKDRYETCVGISMAGWPVSSDYAVIVTGEDFPDALTAAPLAKKYNSPILLTTPEALDPRVDAELARLKVKHVFIVGGTGAVSQSVQNSLESEGIKCTRIFGADRYETSTAVANEMMINNTTGTVVVTTGVDFPDAVSIAPFAAGNGIPILLTDGNSISNSILSCINKNNITDIYVIGGPGAVSDSVMSQLKNAKRIQGADRYSTNLAVLNTFSIEFQFDKLYLASGNNFPDALAGSALAALTKSPIVLTDVKPMRDTKIFINSNIDKLNDVFILGGQAVIPESLMDALITPVVRNIEVIVPNSSVGMGKQAKASVKIGMIPSKASAPDAIYCISDSSVAAISFDGTITGISPGKVTVTALSGGKSGSLDITVKLDKTIVLDPGHGGDSIGATAKLNGNVISEKDLNRQIAYKVLNKLQASGADVILTRILDRESSLQNRAKLANLINADLFVSIHHDSYDETSNGTSAFYSTFKPNIDNLDVYAKAYTDERVYSVDGKVLGNLVNEKEYPVIKEEGGKIYISFNGTTGTVTLDDVIVYDRTPNPASLKSQILASLLNSKISSLGLLSRGITDDNLAVNRMTNMASTLVEIGFMSNANEIKIISQDSFQEQAANKIVEGIVEFYKKK